MTGVKLPNVEQAVGYTSMLPTGAVLVTNADTGSSVSIYNDRALTSLKSASGLTTVTRGITTGYAAGGVTWAIYVTPDGPGQTQQGPFYFEANLAPATSGDFAGIDARVDSVESDLGQRSLNVKSYGAVGNGSTNDTTAIQAALTAAAAAGVPAFLPDADAVYVAAGLSLTGVELRGPGTLKLVAATNGPIATLNDGGTLDGVGVDGNGTNQSTFHTLVDIAGDDTTVRGLNITGSRFECIRVEQNALNARIEGNRLIGNGIGSSCIGIDVRGSYAAVRGNFISNHDSNGHGIRIGRWGDDIAQVTEGVVVEGNVIHDQIGTDLGGTGIIAELDSRHVSIVGNHVSGYYHAMKCDDSSHVTIQGNTIEDCQSITVLNFTGSTHVSFIGNILRNCASGPLMGSHSVCSGNVLEAVGNGTGTIIQAYGPQAVVANNILDSCQSPLAQIRVGPPSGTENGYTVTGNLIEDPTSSAGTHYGIYVDKALHVNVSGNHILGSVSTGIRCISTVSDFICKDNHIPDATTKVDFGGTRAIVADNLFGGLVTMASSAGINLKGNRVVGITGTTSITSITAEPPGVYFLQFAGALTMTDGNNLKLAGNFVTSANATMALFSDGTNFYEVARSTNG